MQRVFNESLKYFIGLAEWISREENWAFGRTKYQDERSFALKYWALWARDQD